MSGLKLPLILLLILVAGFVFLMVRGSSKNNSVRSSGDNKSDAENFSADDYPVVQSLGSVLGAFSPKLDSTQIQPSLATYTLQPQTTYTLKVGADKKHKFRSAKFRMATSTTKRCAHLKYTPAEDPPEELSSLKKQDSEDMGKADQAHPKPEVGFTILAAGGTIIISRNPGFSGPCVVQLEQ